MTYYHIKVVGLDRDFRFQFEPKSTIDDLCLFMQNILGTTTKFDVVLFGFKIKKINSRLIDTAPEDTCFVLKPREPDPQYKFNFIFYEDIPDNQYIVFSNISMQTLLEGELMEIDENQKVKQLKLNIRDKFIEKYGIDRSKQLHLFLPGGCPFLAGTINDFRNCDESNILRKHLYVIITDNIPEDVLNEDIDNPCDASTDEKKLLLSPCFENSSIKGLLTIASLLGYINQESEDTDFLVASFAHFFPFAPLICALHQLQKRNSSRGLTLIQITAPLFTILRDAYQDFSIPDEDLLAKTPEFFTYFINFDINTAIPCTIYIEPFMPISVEAYLQSIYKDKNTKGKQVVTLWDPDFRGTDWIFYLYQKPTNEELQDATDKVHSLEVIPPMDLRKIRRSALFQGINGPWLFLNGTYGKKKDTQDNFDIINPEKGITESVNPEDFANQISTSVRNSMTMDIVDPKKVSQIVYILLDKSYSMFENYHETTLFNAAKQFLISFLDAAYTSLNFSLFGFIPFDGKYNIVCDLTILTPNFREELEKVKRGGATSIFLTVQGAAKKLVEAHEKYSNAVKRIIVLTDGKDNHADYTYEGQRTINIKLGDLANYLIDNKIRVDCMYVSNEIDPRLYKIAKITGGCAFYPRSLEEGLNIFAEEPFYNVLIREFKPFSTQRFTHDDIQNAPEPKLEDWDKHTPSHPEEIAESNDRVLISPSYVTAMNNGSAPPPRRKGRILKELRTMAAIDSEDEGIKVFTFKDNFDQWRVLLRGPDGSKYEKRWFYLTIQFPSQYPSAPPTIRFVLPPYHPNISDTGFICLSNLDVNYRANDTVHDLLTAILGLLMVPNSNDPVDPSRAEIVKKGKEGEYQAKIDEFNNKNSKDRCEDWIVGWNIENDPEGVNNENLNKYKDADTLFKCNLTGKIMTEPVKASSGIYFERSALVQYIRNNPNARCPVTGKQFQESDLNLPVDNNLKVRISKWFEENGKK